MTNYEHLIQAAELKDLIDADQCRVIDCRFDLLHPDKGRSEYLDGHIPGAVYAHLDHDLAAPITAGSGRHPLPCPDAFRATLQNWGIGSDTQIVVYDHASGGPAGRLWWMSRWLGHNRVAVLNGGLAAWSAAGGPLQQSVPQYPAAGISGLPDTGKIATTAEISAAVDGGSRLDLVDARERTRFDGITEPIDAVAGHVPGAVNFPFLENLNPNGTWKTPGELRGAWKRVLGSELPDSFTVMCGSGVTACHLVLSARIAGLNEPRVYVGSWSEWIRDTARPVAAGVPETPCCDSRDADIG
jgi:thiosulfate/3-mercaptopyruvate sulfurtransferase